MTPARPFLVVADDDPAVLSFLARDLRREFGGTHSSRPREAELVPLRLRVQALEAGEAGPGNRRPPTEAVPEAGMGPPAPARHLP